MRRAINIVLPIIMALMKDGTMKRSQMSINVLDPGKRFGDCELEEAILCTVAIGCRENWDGDYKEIAEGKSLISWRTGLPTQIVQERCPHLLVNEDVKWYGNAVLDGIIVSASGVEPWFDQMVSEMIASVCRALCIDQKKKEIDSDKSYDFIGEPE